MPTVATLLLCASSATMAQGWERTDTGILVSPSVGSEKAVRVDVYGNGIFRTEREARRSRQLDGQGQACFGRLRDCRDCWLGHDHNPEGLGAR